MVGQLELRAGNTSAAITRLERSKSRDPDFAPVYLALAAAFSRQGQYDQVAENLQRYLELNPDHHVAHLYLGECLLSLGKDNEARDQFLLYTASIETDIDREKLDRLVHAYRRLVEIADGSRDAFGVELYSGIALYFQARQAVAAAATGQPSQRREILEQAAATLQAAKTRRPNDPNAGRYLTLTHDALSAAPIQGVAAEKQQQPATTAEPAKVNANGKDHAKMTTVARPPNPTSVDHVLDDWLPPPPKITRATAETRSAN